MIITKINCGRVRNLGNFETVRMEVTADLEVGEDSTEAMQRLYAYVDELIQMDIDEVKLAQNLD
jgi:hypothetical protein